MSTRHEVQHDLSFDTWILVFIILWCIGTWVDRCLDRAYPKPAAESTK